jgi:hypothetical protein
MDLRIKQANEQIVSKREGPELHHKIVVSETECDKNYKRTREECLNANVALGGRYKKRDASDW